MKQQIKTCNGKVINFSMKSVVSLCTGICDPRLELFSQYRK